MNADIMHKIPKTFCPAKWDELYVSFEMNYAYACCKSEPTRFTESVMEFIDKEKINMLTGIQDPSCNYCWNVENNGGTSLRHRNLLSFTDDIGKYLDNTALPKLIEINIGNECTFQCTYCNPKFSSKWEQDVRKIPYKVFSDRYFYGIDAKQLNVMDKSFEFLKQFENIETLSVLGGEPLVNKKFFKLIDETSSDSLKLVTNLSASRDIIDKLLQRCSKYKTVGVGVSLDAIGDIAEFTRYGLDFKVFDENLKYLIANKPDNLKITVCSLMTSITVRGIKTFSEYILPLVSTGEVEWTTPYCKNPKIQSMATLPPQLREDIIKTIESIPTNNTRGLDTLKHVVETTPFNNTLYQELKHFMNEFAERKNMTVPVTLD